MAYGVWLESLLEDYQPLQLAHGNRLAVNGLDVF